MVRGFSLVELMVVVGITGTLATLAMPRYKSFLANARRGEAKGHLHIIHTLQESYRVEHGGYYPSSLEVGYFKDGRKVRCNDDDNTDLEKDNKLGFRPNDCEHLRYGYTISGSGGGKAFAPSDAPQRWIYPDCKGCGTTSECGEDQGDVITMSVSTGEPTVCRNIAKYCPDDLNCGSPPPSCSCDPWTLGTPTLVNTAIVFAPAIAMMAQQILIRDLHVQRATHPASVVMMMTITLPLPQ